MYSSILNGSVENKLSYQDVFIVIYTRVFLLALTSFSIKTKFV